MTTENNSGAPEGGAAQDVSTDTGGAPQDNHESLKEIMQFDPFGPAETPAGGPAKQEGEGGEAGAGDKPGEGTPPKDAKPAEPVSPPPPPPPATPQPTRRELELQAQVETLQRTIAQSKEPPKTTEKKQDDPRYNLQIPSQILQALRSDNDQEVGVAMHAIVNGIANRLYQDMQEEFSKRETTLRQEILQQATTQVSARSEQERIGKEFYAKHKALDTPILRNVVQQSALYVARNWQALGKPIEWNEEFMNAVAETVYAAVPGVKTQMQSPPPPPPPAGNKQFHSRPGSRPAGAGAEQSQGNDIMSTIFG